MTRTNLKIPSIHSLHYYIELVLGTRLARARINNSFLLATEVPNEVAAQYLVWWRARFMPDFPMSIQSTQYVYCETK